MAERRASRAKKQPKRDLTELVPTFNSPEGLLEENDDIEVEESTSPQEAEATPTEKKILINKIELTTKTVKKPKKTRFTVDLEEERQKKLEKMCKRTGLSKAELLKQLIDEAYKSFI
ncbi:MAG: ribbon-helix-helix protein, CopG family [Cyanobacteria bacterium P01_D01_bin.116]